MRRLLAALLLVACGGKMVGGATEASGSPGTTTEAGPEHSIFPAHPCPLFRAPTSGCKRRRVWTLGDSLTYGTDGSVMPDSYVGWRLGLDQWIQQNGFGAELIGTLSQGESASPVPLAQPLTDGHPGFTLANLSVQVGAVYGKKPAASSADVVLFLAGTNDMGAGATAYDPDATPAAYLALLEKIARVDTETIIVVSTIPPIDPSYKNGAPAANVIDFNGKLPGLWSTFASRHPNKLIRWDAFAALSPWSEEWFGRNPTHPIAPGYSRMWQALHAALAGS